MLIYISSYPRSGNSLMQDLIGNFFARPITGGKKLIKNKNTKNWRYNNRSLPDNHEEIQLLSSKLTEKEKPSYNLDQIALLQKLHGVTIAQLGYE